jgi:hypothetical protein
VILGNNTSPIVLVDVLIRKRAEDVAIVVDKSATTDVPVGTFNQVIALGDKRDLGECDLVIHNVEFRQNIGAGYYCFAEQNPDGSYNVDYRKPIGFQRLTLPFEHLPIGAKKGDEVELNPSLLLYNGTPLDALSDTQRKSFEAYLRKAGVAAIDSAKMVLFIKDIAEQPKKRSAALPRKNQQ